MHNKDIDTNKTYFIADIAANHDGSLERALRLIELAAESGANAAKFQNFKAETIVSDQGFRDLGKKLTHQANWKKDVFEVYKDAELPIEWTDALISKCLECKIDYFTAPYDLDFIDYFEDKMPFYKIGSGDITWQESLLRIKDKNKPVLLATGASSIDEVKKAMEIFLNHKSQVVIMQCNTNYTGEVNNFKYLNLNVLNQYKEIFPTAILGLSDHSPGHVAVLGAVSLGARVIEKHFTDDVKRSGPDHGFSLDPVTWSAMVSDVRILEECLGDGIKKVEENEVESRVVQRRSLRYARNIDRGMIIKPEDLVSLRPCPIDALEPFELINIIGTRLNKSVLKHQLVSEKDIESD
jgi:N-acetylneuraminate synthase